MNVGDKVRITDTRPTDAGVGSNPFWVQDMDKCLGKIGKIFTISDGNYGVTTEENKYSWYYAPHWLTKIETSLKTDKSLETNKQLLLI